MTTIKKVSPGDFVTPFSVPRKETTAFYRIPFEIESERYRFLPRTDGRIVLWDKRKPFGEQGVRVFESERDARAWWKKWGARAELEP